MPYAVRVSTLYIGQGQANVIEVYQSAAAFNLPHNTINAFDVPDPPSAPNPAADLIFLAVVDFGSHNVGLYRYLPINHIVPLMRRRAAAPVLPVPGNTVGGGAGGIDYISVSHEDADHFDHFQYLAGAYRTATGIRPRVDDLFATTAGVRDFILDANLGFIISQKPGAIRILNTQYARPGGNPYANMGASTYTINLINGHVLRLNMLMYQATLFRNRQRPKGPGTNPNKNSIILFLSITGNAGASLFSCLFSGDATVKTLMEFLNVNKDFDPAAPAPAFFYNFNNNEMKYLTVPHHGAYTTMVNTARNSRAPLGILTGYMMNFGPDIATVSAQRMYDHPDYDTMRTIEVHMNNLVPPDPGHDLVCYDGQPARVINTTKYVYTTYNDTPQVLVAGGRRRRIMTERARNFHVTYTSTGNAVSITTNTEFDL